MIARRHGSLIFLNVSVVPEILNSYVPADVQLPGPCNVIFDPEMLSVPFPLSPYGAWTVK
jgi:hypothetical protein